MATCSQCALRGIQCHLDDSDDVRIRRRRTRTARGGTEKAGTRELQSALLTTSPDDRGIPVSQIISDSHMVSLSPRDDNVVLSNIPFDMFDDSPFALSFDNMAFLDQVFMGEGDRGFTQSSDQPSQYLQQPTSTSGNNPSDDGDQDGRDSNFPSAVLGTCSWTGVSADSASCTAALHSYFEYAAPYLPILLADAFWQDYHAGHCSELLLYAVACRGMPYTEAPNKWDLQNRLASTFREKYLHARSNAPDNDAIRLDDLEALALMIDFEYDNSESLPLLSNLGRLFLTHDSLVLTAINYRILDLGVLARASERRVLLYWHIYGLDAFHCLDRMQISRIPSNDLASNEDLSSQETKDYFDALLALAVIARQITQNLCSPLSKRQGIKPSDVHNLYEQLGYWRDTCCPHHLRMYKDDTGRLEPFDITEPSSSRTRKHTQLYRAVLWALELHCRLQIEDCICEHGIQDRTSLEAEVLARRVEYTSLCALNEMVNVCLWIKQLETQHQDYERHSLIDLAPKVLRNICAGMCYWSCLRGIDLVNSGSLPRLLRSSHENDGDDGAKRQILNYVEIARLLRDTAATATSHQDTAQILERIDKQRALLDSRLDGA